MFEINRPEIVAEVREAFMRYEKALNENDVPVLNELFWDTPHTLRYGATENLYGHAEIAAFRVARQVGDARRDLLRVVITTYGQDMATANCEFRRSAGGPVGRQSQTWMRTPQGWRIVAAHVSLLQKGS